MDLPARVGLSTNTNAVADLDALDVAANLDSLANNLVANAACYTQSEWRGLSIHKIFTHGKE